MRVFRRHGGPQDAVMAAATVAGATFVGLGLPDLGRLLRIIERIKELLTVGGAALATVVSLLFILAWVGAHLRQPTRDRNALLPYLALWVSYIPIALTLVAGLGVLVPLLAGLILKAIALATLAAAVAWLVAVIALALGGHRRDLDRSRLAMLLAGTPWYCLATWLAGQL